MSHHKSSLGSAPSFIRPPVDIPPEVRILAWTALPADGGTQRIRRLAQDGLDWPRLVALSRAHRMVSLLYAAVRAAELEPPPAPLLRELAAEARIAAARAVQHHQDLTFIASAFETADIPFIVLKGLPLSQRLYGDPTLRDSKDIDLLVQPCHRRAACDALTREGYSRVGPHLTPAQHWFLDRFGTEMLFIHPVRGTNVELHWALHQRSAHSEHPLFNRGRGDRSPGCHSLPPSEDALDLLAHGALHAWHRLKWLTDLWQAWSSYEVDWTQWRRDAVEAGLEPALTSAILLAGWIVPEYRLPAGIRGETSSRRGLLLARRAGRTIVAPAPGERPADQTLVHSLAELAFHIFTATPERRRRMIQSGLIWPADIEVVELPKWAYRFYPPLKPLLWVIRRLRPRAERPIAARTLAESPEPAVLPGSGGAKYLLYGLRVASDIPLPLAPSHGEAHDDITVSVRSGPGTDADGEDWVLTVPACGRIVVSRGSSVFLEPAPGADAADLTLHLLGSTLAVLCWTRKWVPLHAAAVRFDERTILITGPSGAGKSTLAAACVAQGAELLSDDISPLTLGSDGAVVMPGPGPRQVKLWSEAARRFTSPKTPGRLVQAGVTKLKFEVPRVREGGAPVATLLCLEKHEEPLPAIPLHGVDALRAIAGSVYRPTLIPANMRAHALDTIVTLAGKLAVFRVPRGPDGLDAVGRLAHSLATGSSWLTQRERE